MVSFKPAFIHICMFEDGEEDDAVTNLFYASLEGTDLHAHSKATKDICIVLHDFYFVFEHLNNPFMLISAFGHFAAGDVTPSLGPGYL